MLQQVGRGREKESSGEREAEGGGKRSRQVREWPAGTGEQLVFDSEREKGGKEKAARGEKRSSPHSGNGNG